MSRVGKLPIAVPSGVTITVDDDFVTVTGPKGTLKQFTVPGISYKLEDGEFVLSRASDEQLHRANHGLMRALVNNMVVGVTTGFTKKLEINGVGYRAAMEGSKVKFQLGYSHDILFPIPEGIKIEIEQNVVSVSGISKQQVGQVAAEIRALRKPEPYKGKGIKYSDERIIRKSGKSGKDK